MADILNPAVTGATVSPYPPELQLEAQKIARRRAITDMLMMRTMQPAQQPTGYGGQPVPMSPFAALTPLLGGILAARGMGKSDEASTELAGKYSTGLASARAAMLDRIAKGDLAGANAVAGPWPALSHLADAAAMQTLPKRELTKTFDTEGREQPSIVDINAPAPTAAPVGLPKPNVLHPVETADAGGQPQTSFVDLTRPQEPMPKPVKVTAVPLGGTTDLINPYQDPTTLKHTIDPNRVPLPEDIDATAKMIAEYRMPGYTGNAARSPGGTAIMRRVSEMNPTYDAAIFPVAKAGEINFIEKNGPQIRAFGTLARHTEAAKDLFKALDNPTDIPALNQARNFFQQEFGVAAPTQVSLAKQFIADEMAKAVLNGPGALDDRKHFAEALSRSASKAQFAGDLDTTMKFAVEQMKGHEQQYKSMTKSNRADFQERFLDPQMKAIYNRYGGGRRSGDQTPPGLPDPAAIDAELAKRKAAGG